MGKQEINYRAMTSKQLERIADVMIYGAIQPDIENRVIGKPLYMPSQKPIVRAMPKQWREKKRCIECNEPISDSAGCRCNYCYRSAVQSNYRERLGWMEYWTEKATGGFENGKRVGVTYQEHEYARNE